MSKRTFNMFSDALHKIYHDYLSDYKMFRESADALLSKAYFHREINNAEYHSLLDIYDRMCEYTQFGALENENE